MKMVQLLTILSILLNINPQSYIENSFSSISNNAHIENKIFDSRIYTVQIHKPGWNLSYPFIRLSQDEKLELHFDILDDDLETLYYSFIHCDKDWNRSDLTTFEYLDGFPENDIEDVNVSYNTTVDYYHYSIEFPNEDVSFRISGNYAIVVYTDNIDEPLLLQRFVVVEDGVGITAEVDPPQMSIGDNTSQQVNISIKVNNSNIIDPARNIYTTILQNGRWDNAKTNIKPNISNNNSLTFNSLSTENIFDGGNEFRSFDSRNTKYKGENIRQIEFNSSYYNMYLTPSSSRGEKAYFNEPDFNGKYYIAIDNRDNFNLEADYVWVHFTLPYIAPMGSEVYIYGALTNWSISDKYRMTFNGSEYEASLLLKQGWYNFEYVIKQSNGDLDFKALEGNHYETENDYIILVYYRDPRERYDKLIGYYSVNSNQQR